MRTSSLFRAVLGVATMLWAGTAGGAPADVLESPGRIEADTAEPSGDQSTSPTAGAKTGAFEHVIPLVVPPGRLQAHPGLELAYSSHSPLYGGVAAGWSLPVPEIGRDWSDGAYGPVRWKSSLTGRSLVPVEEAVPTGMEAFRAQGDASFARYQRNTSTGHWHVLFPDGSTMTFGEPALIEGDGFDDWYPLTRTADAFGNEVQYQWEAVADDVTGDVVEYRLAAIEYGMNPNAGLDAHARVELAYGAPSRCTPSSAPIGKRGQLSLRCPAHPWLRAAVHDHDAGFGCRWV